MFEVKLTLGCTPELLAAIGKLSAALENNASARQRPSGDTATHAGPAPAVPSTVGTQTPADPPAQPTVEPQTPADPPTQPTVETQTPADPPKGSISLDAISHAGAALLDQGRMPELIALLDRYGVKAITQLDASQYDAVAADLRALGAAI